jgi:D-alanine-D-alanine ligase
MSNPPRILVLYNEPVLPPDHPDAATEVEILETLELVERALRTSGFAVSRLGVGNDLHVLIDGLNAERPDAVFNLFEGLGDRPFTESVVAGVMEWLSVPFTGSPSEALTLARDKRRTKLMFQGAGLPTAPFVCVERLPAPECRLPWPVIVKPALLDCSLGIEQASVAVSQAELERRVTFVLPRYGPVLVERFIPGREFHVFVVEGEQGGLLTLPPTEIVFEDPAAWPIYSYNAKWATGSAEFHSTPIRPLAALPDDLGRRVAEVASDAYRLLGCRDYARVDLRVTPEGEPFILEVNTNPYVGSDGLAEGLAALGRSYEQFLAGVARAALARRAAPADPCVRQFPTAPARRAGPPVELS